MGAHSPESRPFQVVNTQSDCFLKKYVLLTIELTKK